MNVTQLKYARQRAEAILNARIADLRKKHTTSKLTLTVEEKLEALRAGNFTINEDALKGAYHPYWYNAVEFAGERNESFDEAAFNAEKSVIDEAYRNLEDDLILGDSETALELLKEFEGAAAA